MIIYSIIVIVLTVNLIFSLSPARSFTVVIMQFIKCLVLWPHASIFLALIPPPRPLPRPLFARNAASLALFSLLFLSSSPRSSFDPVLCVTSLLLFCFAWTCDANTRLKIVIRSFSLHLFSIRVSSFSTSVFFPFFPFSFSPVFTSRFLLFCSGVCSSFVSFSLARRLCACDAFHFFYSLACSLCSLFSLLFLPFLHNFSLPSLFVSLFCFIATSRSSIFPLFLYLLLKRQL